jgi:hypothetical protein
MWSIVTKKFFVAIRSNQSGQAILEYILVILVVLGIFMIAARPMIGKLGKKINDGIKGGIFAEDSTGGKFYYFPVK